MIEEILLKSGAVVMVSGSDDVVRRFMKGQNEKTLNQRLVVRLKRLL